MIKKLGTSFISYFVFLQFINVTVRASNSYCSLDCQSTNYVIQGHPMCIYKQSGPGPKCSGAKPGVTEEEKQLIINLHNQLRQQVARGQEFRGSPGPQPAAASMPNLEWDTELEMTAQKWADQCIYGHACGAVDRFKVGQNIAIRWTYPNYPGLADIELLVKGWYDEVAIFNNQLVSAYRFNKAYGHYSQMVWSKTTKIGCGINRYEGYKNGHKCNFLYLVCNYGPAGNVITEPVY